MANENWCMTGYHSVSVLSDAIAKGLKVDGKEALEAMVSTSSVPWYSGLGEYIQLGYVPLEKTSTAASNTLEYAYDDWTIAVAAERLGNAPIAQRYLKRAGYWKNVFDASLGLARPRYADGRFKEPFDIKQTVGQGFIEGCARPDGADGRGQEVHRELGRALRQRPAGVLLCGQRGHHGRLPPGRLCPWERAQPPHPVPVCLDLRALEDAVLGPGDRGPLLPPGNPGPGRERRLRPDERVVHLRTTTAAR